MENGFIAGVDESVMEGPGALMAPQLGQGLVLGAALGADAEDPLEDLAHIPEVERVVAPSWGREQLIDDLLKQLDRAVDAGLLVLLEARREALAQEAA